MRGLKWIIDAALAICLLVLGLLAAPKAAGFRTYAVISRSMSPALPVGSVVYVKKEELHDIRVGDIITYRPQDAQICVTHRVVQKNEAMQSLRTKGDANEHPDGEVQYEDVVGVVHFSIPGLGYIAVLLESAAQKLLAGGVLCWLFMVRMILLNIMEMKEKEVRVV